MGHRCGNGFRAATGQKGQKGGAARRAFLVSAGPGTGLRSQFPAMRARQTVIAVCGQMDISHGPDQLGRPDLWRLDYFACKRSYRLPE